MLPKTENYFAEFSWYSRETKTLGKYKETNEETRGGCKGEKKRITGRQKYAGVGRRVTYKYNPFNLLCHVSGKLNIFCLFSLIGSWQKFTTKLSHLWYKSPNYHTNDINPYQ